MESRWDDSGRATNQHTTPPGDDPFQHLENCAAIEPMQCAADGHKVKHMVGGNVFHTTKTQVEMQRRPLPQPLSLPRSSQLPGRGLYSFPRTERSRSPEDLGHSRYQARPHRRAGQAVPRPCGRMPKHRALGNGYRTRRLRQNGPSTQVLQPEARSIKGMRSKRAWVKGVCAC